VLSVKTKVLAEDFGYDIHVVTLNQKSKTDLFFPFSEKIIQHNLKFQEILFSIFQNIFQELKK
jgi:hypothetical protein